MNMNLASMKVWKHNTPAVWLGPLTAVGGAVGGSGLNVDTCVGTSVGDDVGDGEGISAGDGVGDGVTAMSQTTLQLAALCLTTRAISI